ncbi:oxygenase MpaB family protein [Streptomyces sp. NPDC058620]|uniref:oxygenase MpaB family protein n=1 Tax=Streptomyces sp. NPDC058620 TaxID=3346560 RepID=UPI0036647C70
MHRCRRAATTATATDDSLFRRTLGERSIALVAWRLLVLQNADPAVAAGVARFSTYRAHPWRRVELTEYVTARADTTAGAQLLGRP